MYHGLHNKIVFLTGGTGSFGQGFIRLLLEESDVSMIRCYSRDEHKQRELLRRFGRDRLSVYIGDVRDKNRIKRVLEGSDWVVHAAALKQAPFGEIEGQEFVKTNVFGTINLIESCLDLNVDRMLFISSDKAVEPINLYGATKMVAEKLTLQANAMRGTKETKFSCVRYGNVAMTSGSVIPFFLSLKIGEPTPISNIHSTRFWISLDEANRFVLESLIDMSGNEIFIPKLKSVKILDIAEALRPEEEVKIIGLRPGDKLHELLRTEPRYCSDNNEFLTVDEIREYVDRVRGKEPNKA